MTTLADIIREYGEAFEVRYGQRLLPSHRAILPTVTRRLLVGISITAMPVRCLTINIITARTAIVHTASIGKGQE